MRDRCSLDLGVWTFFGTCKNHANYNNRRLLEAEEKTTTRATVKVIYNWNSTRLYGCDTCLREVARQSWLVPNRCPFELYQLDNDRWKTRKQTVR